MNVYLAYFSQTGAWGYYKHIQCVVVANTESEALGVCLQEHTDTHASGWSFELLNTNALSITTLNQDES